MWVVYLLGKIINVYRTLLADVRYCDLIVSAVTPSTAIYEYAFTSSCLTWREDCNDNDICWQVDETKLKNYTQTINVLFLTAGTLLLLAAYYKRDRQKFDRKKLRTSH